MFNALLVFNNSVFSRSVWDTLRKIPVGETRSYKEIAIGICKPNAVRAVARANGANQLALIVPCHRVTGADGSFNLGMVAGYDASKG